VRAEADLALLVAPTEVALLRKLADYPDVLATAALGLAPHEVAFYLRDLAAAFTATTAPSASWSTTRGWRERASPCSGRRARSSAMRSRCSASAPPNAWTGNRKRKRMKQHFSSRPSAAASSSAWSSAC
jgi:hypothetical protein